MMKKAKKITPKVFDEDEQLSMVNEPNVFYGNLRTTSALKEFTYNDFKKIADKIPFTLAEWATILHVSERTLQRYAKNNTSFAPINSERIALIEKVLQEAKTTFGNTNKFYDWISRNPYMLEGNLSIHSLSTFEGIQNVLTQLGRIQHGIFA
jgi:putative toxin-antitoxin system antitoxin component (TIGR02293 family)